MFHSGQVADVAAVVAGSTDETTQSDPSLNTGAATRAAEVFSLGTSTKHQKTSSKTQV